ncbi:MAG TPA: TlpA disulfide reductase family protein [Phycisphaerales bacterium]|nr:TlpA disulfide reductase family protein [Phycisphaerales bacterium]
MQDMHARAFMLMLLVATGASLTTTGCGGSRPSQPMSTLTPALHPQIGKPPPLLHVGKWIKGEPVANFERGTVYVVDFWATWCGPCRAAMPHLSRMQREHAGKVQVIGVSILERATDDGESHDIEATIAHVTKFVDRMDDRMDYRVAVDTADEQMLRTWYKPSNTGGIPTAWIIDQRGNVVWIGIGSPKTVERIVNEVLAGTFDSAKEAARIAAEDAAAKKRAEADIAAATAKKSQRNDIFAKYPGYKEAMDRGDQLAALAALDAAFARDASLEVPAAYQWKLMLLMQRAGGGKRPDEVNQYVRELIQRHGDNADVMSFASACIVSTDDEPSFDRGLALDTAQRAAKFAEPDSRWQQFTLWRLAWAQFHTGDASQALATMQQAKDNIARLQNEHDFGDLAMQCDDAIRMFRKQLK